MVVTNASKKRETDQTMVPGKYLLMEVHIPPSSRLSQRPLEIITAFDREKYQVSWQNREYPTWMLKAERWQVLSVVAGKTLYESRETFTGSLAYVLRTMMGGSLVKSFEAMADGLKDAAEAKAASTPSLAS